MKLICFLFAGFLLASCVGKDTTNPNEAYKYWAGGAPPSEIQVLNGKYWESAHWSMEYIVYLRLKVTDKWWSEFVESNQLIKNSSTWIRSSDAPDWFLPPANFIRYKRDDDFQNSRYFHDPQSGECYIYEIQL